MAISKKGEHIVGTEDFRKLKIVWVQADRDFNFSCFDTAVRSSSRRLSLLPPAYVVRREGNSFTLFVSPHLGGGTHIP